MMKKAAEITTVEQSINSGQPHLVQLKNQFGTQAVETIVAAWLLDLNETLNLVRPMKEHHIDEVAFTIVQDFPWLNMTDLNIVFRKAKKGGYGSFYESLSMPKIISWFSEYYETRFEVAESISIREAQKFKHFEKQSSLDITQKIQNGITDSQGMHDFKIEYLKGKSK